MIFSKLVLIQSLNTFRHKYPLFLLCLSVEDSPHFVRRNYFNAKKANNKTDTENTRLQQK